MLLKEYRITLPVSVEEYHIAQLYMVMRKSLNESSKDGEGIEVVVNEPFEDDKGKGQYTHKIMRIGQSMPGWVRRILPSSACQFEERAWNAFPYCRTEYSCAFFGSKFALSVESLHVADGGDSDNALSLTADELKERIVDKIDIIEDPFPTGSNYKKDEDPRIFKSEKTGRGPFPTGKWEEGYSPKMTCYKVVRAKAALWPLQGKLEQVIQNVAIRKVFLEAHRQLVCWMDDWFGLTVDDIRRLEDEAAAKLAEVGTGAAPKPAPADKPSVQAPDSPGEPGILSPNTAKEASEMEQAEEAAAATKDVEEGDPGAGVAVDVASEGDAAASRPAPAEQQPAADTASPVVS